MGKGGGGTTTVNQSSLPGYAKPYFKDLMQRGESESLRPYTPFQGQRISDVTPAITNAQGDILGMTPSGAYGQAQGILTNASNAAGGVDNYFGPFQDYRTNVSSFMSPYMQDVVNQQKSNALLDFNRAQSGRDAQAVKAGAFGGSRGAVVDALAQEDLSRRMDQIQAEGSQRAFENASTAFENQRGAGMQYDVNRAMYGLQGLGMQGDFARSMAGIADAQQAADLGLYDAQMGVGRDQRAEQQAQLDLNYQDFINQRDYGRSQLDFYSSLLRGIPVQPTTQTSQITQVNPLQQLLGGGLAALGTYKSLMA